MSDFYKNKKVLITGHTGFKGAWLSQILINFGADVTGYSLAPTLPQSLFQILDISSRMKSYIGDIRNLDDMFNFFKITEPEIVFHLAAQPLVRDSYKDPRYTYETNVMGTVNILECVRNTAYVKSFLNVTTDKVYKNNEWVWGYREDEELDGFDPYSNSKSCSELVTHCYKNSFFADNKVAISTARAGNVIGGGDFANDRIIPDCFRYTSTGQSITVRNPYSTRPYQHVLEPLSAYLKIAECQYKDYAYADYYNVGPDECDCITTGDLVDIFCKHWGSEAKRSDLGNKQGPHEANFLKLDCSKLKNTFGWQPLWNIDEATAKTVEWYKAYINGEKMIFLTEKQIADFFSSKRDD